MKYLVIEEKTVTTAKTGGDIGKAFAQADSDTQAEFLVEATKAAIEFSWPVQCAAIRKDMPENRRAEVCVMLETLLEHLK